MDDKKYHKNLMSTVVLLWQRYHEEYDTIVDEYESLLAEKREKKIKPLDPISQGCLAEFPRISFLLNNKSEEEAKKCAMNLTIDELRIAIADINIYINSYIRNTLRNHICDYKYQISRREKKKNFQFAAVNPDTRSSNAKKFGRQ